MYLDNNSVRIILYVKEVLILYFFLDISLYTGKKYIS